MTVLYSYRCLVVVVFGFGFENREEEKNEINKKDVAEKEVYLILKIYIQ